MQQRVESRGFRALQRKCACLVDNNWQHARLMKDMHVPGKINQRSGAAHDGCVPTLRQPLARLLESTRQLLTFMVLISQDIPRYGVPKT